MPALVDDFQWVATLVDEQLARHAADDAIAQSRLDRVGPTRRSSCGDFACVRPSLSQNMLRRFDRLTSLSTATFALSSDKSQDWMYLWRQTRRRDDPRRSARSCFLRPHAAMLVNATTPLGGGDAAFSDAIASLFLTVALWIVLALLLVNAGLMGAMPRWSAIVAVMLVPLSGVAAFVAIDMCSRHMQWAIAFPATLPPLIAAYAMWTRLPRLRALLPSSEISLAAWSMVFVLSIAPLILGETQKLLNRLNGLPLQNSRFRSKS
jgi:hypothetical protein